MDQQSMVKSLLDLVERPAFCVIDEKIVLVNGAARQLLISEGTSLAELLADNADAYARFHGGTLALRISVCGTPYDAQVSRTGDADVFVLEADSSPMRAIALAAQNLRGPLSSVMTVADLLEIDDPTYSSQLQKGLHSLQRIVCNMSDSYRYQQTGSANLETTNITSVFDESMEAIGAHLDHCGISVQYTAANAPVYGLADREMLERAIYNLISNSVKFMASGSTLSAKLTQSGKLLSFCVQTETDQSLQEGMFNRYQRQPNIEDSRYGIGLGMPLVRAIAAAHGGTVLIDHPEAQSIRITMTISVNQSEDTSLRSSVRLPVSNYAGGRDRGLLELSEILPADAYINKN